MQLYGERRLYAATDVVGFLECEHFTTLSLVHLRTPLKVAEADESDKLVQEKGFEHEREYAEHLRMQGLNVVDISVGNESIEARVQATLEAMKSGVDVIYQATLLDGCLVGFADFLTKIPRPSALGDHSYEVSDTKLSRTPKAKFLVQLAFYSRLLEQAQGVAPLMMHVVLGDRAMRSYRCADFLRYFDSLLERFLTRVEGEAQGTYPEPCDFCSLCRWSEICEQKWLDDDHLSQVANITRIQIGKLQMSGVTKMAELATVADGTVAKMGLEMLQRLRAQAKLQVHARETGERSVEKLPLDPDRRRGFFRLPQPKHGDMFFDMEGNPWEEGGLEYLFGVYYRDAEQWQFRGFWAHDRQQERVAFEQFIDFVKARLTRYPGSHVYHYAKYEETALKKLMSLHATREADVDNMLRHGILVDLYQVVREAIRVSEPRYSIKDIEHFYLDAREGDVTNAGASIVWYEKWRETKEQKLLDDIEAYNKDDVRSTQLLLDWLLELRPAEIPWAQPPSGDDAGAEAAIAGELTEAEARLVPYRIALVDPLPPDRLRWSDEEQARELAYQLLDFHRRADKPAYWALYARQDMTEEDLLEDPECLAKLEEDPAHPPYKDKRSIVYTYRYPAQETKLRDGSSVTWTATRKALGEISMDPETRRVSLRQSASKDPLPARLSLGPTGPIGSGVIRDALFRFADSVIAGDHAFPAVEAILRREPPRVRGHAPGPPLIPGGKATVEATIDVVSRLDSSYLFIQGPPGAGKTYTGKHLIVALLRAGKRVGVTLNSHKPIHHLLMEVVKQAQSEGFAFAGAKKPSQGNSDTEFVGPLVTNLYSNDDVWASRAQLIAGTAWLFSDPAAAQSLDYLFVDEAGQVALANLVAMGTSAKNVVLLGDQMQLAQPIQGVHPGRSGDSSLDYLLGSAATIAADRGLFLETTWRMHPHVCQFISDAVYDSRLEPEPGNATRVLRLSAGAHALLKASGISYAPVEHSGCAQQSPEETRVIRQVYESALQQQYVDRQGAVRQMTPDNILVVAPYNMQVNLLRDTLPAGARVGTVDKFQGQEAEIVLISMTTSSEAELPRHIEFLYSKNRLNVAISRAKCLAVLVMSPRLLSIKCSTPEEMSLVNTLCWVSAL